MPFCVLSHQSGNLLTTPRMVVNHYRRFGTAYHSHIQRSRNFRFLDPWIWER